MRWLPHYPSAEGSGTLTLSSRRALLSSGWFPCNLSSCGLYALEKHIIPHADSVPPQIAVLSIISSSLQQQGQDGAVAAAFGVLWNLKGTRLPGFHEATSHCLHRYGTKLRPCREKWAELRVWFGAGEVLITLSGDNGWDLNLQLLIQSKCLSPLNYSQ